MPESEFRGNEVFTFQLYIFQHPLPSTIEEAETFFQCSKNDEQEARYFRFSERVFCIVCNNTTEPHDEILAFSCGHAICFVCGDNFVAMEIATISFDRHTPDQAFNLQSSLLSYVGLTA